MWLIFFTRGNLKLSIKYYKSYHFGVSDRFLCLPFPTVHCWFCQIPVIACQSRDSVFDRDTPQIPIAFVMSSQAIKGYSSIYLSKTDYDVETYDVVVCLVWVDAVSNDTSAIERRQNLYTWPLGDKQVRTRKRALSKFLNVGHAITKNMFFSVPKC